MVELAETRTQNTRTNARNGTCGKRLGRKSAEGAGVSFQLFCTGSLVAGLVHPARLQEQQAWTRGANRQSDDAVASSSPLGVGTRLWKPRHAHGWRQVV